MSWQTDGLSEGALRALEMWQRDKARLLQSMARLQAAADENAAVVRQVEELRRDYRDRHISLRQHYYANLLDDGDHVGQFQ